MTVTLQIILGSSLLGLCSLFHITLLVWGVSRMRKLGAVLRFRGNTYKLELLTIFAFGVVVAAHTIQVWLWALALVFLGAFESFADGIYFSLVTYTTLGYGDVTLEEGLRVFGAMASVTGLLNFGLSTAFLVGVFTHILTETR